MSTESLERVQKIINDTTPQQVANLTIALRNYTQAYVTAHPKAAGKDIFENLFKTASWGPSREDLRDFLKEASAVEKLSQLTQAINHLRIELASTKSADPAKYSYAQACKDSPDFASLHSQASLKIGNALHNVLSMTVSVVDSKTHQVKNVFIGELNGGTGGNETIILHPPKDAAESMSEYLNKVLVLQQKRADGNDGATAGGLANSFALSTAEITKLVLAFAGVEFETALAQMNFTDDKDLLRHTNEIKILKDFLAKALSKPANISEPTTDCFLAMCKSLQKNDVYKQSDAAAKQNMIKAALNLAVDDFVLVGADNLPLHKDTNERLMVSELYNTANVDGNIVFSVKPEYAAIVNNARLISISEIDETALHTIGVTTRSELKSLRNSERETFEEGAGEHPSATQILDTLYKTYDTAEVKTVKTLGNGTAQSYNPQAMSNGTHAADSALVRASDTTVLFGTSRETGLRFPPSLTRDQACKIHSIYTFNDAKYVEFKAKFETLSNEYHAEKDRTHKECRGWEGKSLMDTALEGGCVLTSEGIPQVADVSLGADKNHYTYPHEVRVAFEHLLRLVVTDAIETEKNARVAAVEMMQVIAYKSSQPEQPDMIARFWDFATMAKISYLVKGENGLPVLGDDYRQLTFKALAEELFNCHAMKTALGANYSTWCVAALKGMEKAAQKIYFKNKDNDGSLQLKFNAYKESLRAAEDEIHSTMPDQSDATAVLKAHFTNLDPAAMEAIFTNDAAFSELVKHCLCASALTALVTPSTLGHMPELLTAIQEAYNAEVMGGRGATHHGDA